MTLYEYDEELHKQTIRKESYEDGFDDGFNNGFENGFGDGFNNGFDNGFGDGELTNLTKLVCRKLQKNKSPETIADELEEDIDTIQHICDIATDLAPDYDVAKIVEQYKQSILNIQSFYTNNPEHESIHIPGCYTINLSEIRHNRSLQLL